MIALAVPEWWLWPWEQPEIAVLSVMLLLASGYIALQAYRMDRMSKRNSQRVDHLLTLLEGRVTVGSPTKVTTTGDQSR